MRCWSLTRLNTFLNFSVFALDPGLDEGGVEEDEEGGGADEPEEGTERGRPPQDRDTYNEESGVERFLGDDVFAYLQRLGSEFVDGGEASDEEGEGDEEEGVGQECVDRKGEHDHQVVPREVAGVVRDALSRSVQVSRLGDTLIIEELGRRSESTETSLPELFQGLGSTKSNFHVCCGGLL
jgi:hypothetical protein